MRFNIFPGSVITTPICWYSATQAEPTIWPKFRKRIGDIIVTFSKDCTASTYNAEVIITNEIDQHYSGIQISP